jgi:cyclic pyranopterin phosphate synthase
MPLEKYRWVKHEEVLTFEEVTRLAAIFLGLGVQRIRLTGGEPLLRADVEVLVEMLAGLRGLEELSMTSNGSLLAGRADALQAAGIARLNVSLDTVDPDTFRTVSQRGELENVLQGLEAARAAGFSPIKINTVVERGVNDHQLLDMVEFARREGYELRFIEYMDVGTANRWTLDKLVPAGEIVARIKERYPVRPVDLPRGSAPARQYEFEDGGGRLGIVASVTAPFCGDCTRARLTAEGALVTCLFAEGGTDLKGPMRRGADDGTLAGLIESVWRQRADRFSEARLDALLSDDGYDPDERSKIEMIRLGG